MKRNNIFNIFTLNLTLILKLSAYSLKLIAAALLLFLCSPTLFANSSSNADKEDLKKSRAELTDVDVDPASLGRPSFQHFGDREGLPQNSIMTMAIDATGYLWIGTQDGAAYYNGRSWTVVNMPNATTSNFVLSMMVGHDNSLWFGTGGAGLSQRKDGNFITYNSSNGLPNDIVESLLETIDRNGTPVIWAGTHGNGLAKFSQGKWTVFNKSSGLPDDVVLSLLETIGADGNRILWAGTENGLAALHNGRWSLVEIDPSLPSRRIRTMLETVDEQGARTLWVGIDGGGLARLQNDRWTVFNTENGLPSNRIASLLETRDKDGRALLLAGTYGSGLACLRNNRWSTLDTKSGLPNNTISSLAAGKNRDSLQTCWIGTDGGGLARWQLGKWINYDTNTGLPNNIVMGWAESINSDGSQTIWMSMDGGKVARLQYGKLKIFAESDGLPNFRLPSMTQTKDSSNHYTIWAGSWGGGLLKYDGAKWTVISTKNSALPNDNIFALCESKENGESSLLIGTDGGGLARLQQDQITVLNESGGLPSNRILSLLETAENDGTRSLWVGSWDKGLARRKGLNGRWQIYDLKSGLPGNMITCLLEQQINNRHYLWIGTFSGGLARLDLSSNEIVNFSTETNPKLPNNTISRLTTDAQGRLYILTNKGLARLTARAPTADNNAEYGIYTFTVADGLPSNECTAAVMTDSRGRIWAGTLSGAVMLDLSQELIDDIAKPLYLEQASVNDREHRDNLLALSMDRELAYNENNISFEYALLSYFRENETSYRTQLAGYEQQPSNWTTDFKSTFTNLGEGNYTFKLWGRDYAGNISGPIEHRFRIKAAPWRTWWAYGLYLCLLAGGWYGWIWVRIQGLQKSNLVLEHKIAERTSEIAQKNHQLADTVEQLKISEQQALQANQAKSMFLSNMSHELRTPLNAILGFTQILERDKRLDQDQRQSIATISHSGEHLLGLINDILSISKIEAGKLALNEETFDLYQMLNSIEEMVRVRTQSKHLQLIVDTAPELPQFVRGDEGKLRQVLINLLGNAVKFTEQGGIVLRIKWQSERAFFEVEDTGQGIAPQEINKLFEAFEQTSSGKRSQEGTGLGLVISRNFVRLMNGDIRVRSELGKGTVFSFDVRLARATEEQQARRAQHKVIGLVVGQRPRKMLVVDDRPENRILLTRLLMQVGFQAREAANGKEAVELWQSWQPDLVWMDMRMPVMDGITATRTIRALEKDLISTDPARERVTIIGLTASAFEHDREEIMKGGCDDFVTKPYRENTIFEKINEHLGVKYIFEDNQPVIAKPVEPVVTATKIATLPKDLVGRLSHVLRLGDVRAAQNVVKQIRDFDEMLADELKDMIKSYRFDEILDLVDKLDFSH